MTLLIDMKDFSMNAKEYYDRVSVRYDSDTKTNLMKAEDRILFDYLGIEEGTRILDAGCGTGLVLDCVNSETLSSIEYMGYDISDGMLEVFQQKWPNFMITQKSFLDSHEEYYQSFDLVLCLYGCLNCLLTMEDLAVAIRNLWDSVRPGGRMVLVPYGNNPPEKRETSVHNIFSDQVDGYDIFTPSVRFWELTMDNLHSLKESNVIPFSESVQLILKRPNPSEEECYQLMKRQMKSHVTKQKYSTTVNLNLICDFLICDAIKKG